MSDTKFNLSKYPEPAIDPRLDVRIHKVQEMINRFDSCQLSWREEKKILTDELIDLLRRRYPLIYVVKAKSFYAGNIKVEGYNYCYCTSRVEAEKIMKNYHGPRFLEIKFSKSEDMPGLVLFNLNTPVNVSE